MTQLWRLQLPNDTTSGVGRCHFAQSWPLFRDGARRMACLRCGLQSLAGGWYRALRCSDEWLEQIVGNC